MSEADNDPVEKAGTPPADSSTGAGEPSSPKSALVDSSTAVPRPDDVPKDDSAEADRPIGDSPAAEPVKKKRRKKKPAPEAESAAPRPERDANGRDRPVFLLDFPHDPELEPLITAFELGNYAHVREFAPRLIERSERAEVQAAARELLERIEPDPLVKFLLFVAIALFVVVVLLVYHSHG